MFGEYAVGLHDDPAGHGRWTGFIALAFPLVGAFWLSRENSPSTWAEALRDGTVFGGLGGVVGGSAIYVYFAWVNPGFNVLGQTVDAGAQALSGFIGSFVLGTLLVLAMFALRKRRKRGDD